MGLELYNYITNYNITFRYSIIEYNNIEGRLKKMSYFNFKIIYYF